MPWPTGDTATPYRTNIPFPARNHTKREAQARSASPFLACASRLVWDVSYLPGAGWQKMVPKHGPGRIKKRPEHHREDDVPAFQDSMHLVWKNETTRGRSSVGHS